MNMEGEKDVKTKGEAPNPEVEKVVRKILNLSGGYLHRVELGCTYVEKLIEERVNEKK